MHSVRLISEIYRNKWLIEPLFAMQQGPVLASLINGQPKLSDNQPSADNEQPKLKCFAIDAQEPSVRYNYYSGWDRAPFGSVAIIPVEGPLMKEDQYCGPDGMATIGRIIQQADKHPNIKAIVLRIDSPGGTVDGTETLANIIKATEKPILAFVDGLMASAALWIGTSADEIWASTDTDEIGSVGVLLSFMDIQPYYESQGVKFHTIKASTSPDKVKVWEDLRAGKYDTYIKEVLDPLDEKFMNTVRHNRPNIEDRHLTGKMFFARDIMGALIDSIGTFENAIDRASQLADEKENSDNNIINNKISSMNQFVLLNAVLGVATLESVDDAVSLNEEQLQEIEGALEQTNIVAGERDTAIAERDAANAARDLAVTEQQDATAARDEAVNARTTAEENLLNAFSAFDAIDATVAAAETPEAKAEAIRTLLALKPGAKPEGNLNAKDADVIEFDGFTAEEIEASKNL